MLGILGSILSFIPGLTNLGNTWVKAHYDAQVQEIIARTGADRDVAVKLLEMQQAVQTRWWFVAAIPPLFALPYVLYVWRAVFWDNVVLGGAGSTPEIKGILATIFIMIVTFYFYVGARKG